MKNNIKEIIEELNIENGSNYKLATLKNYIDHPLLKLTLGMTYDKVRYTYGVTMKNVEYPTNFSEELSLIGGLKILTDEFVTRNTTGNKAITLMEETLSKLSEDDAWVLAKVLDRDLKINMGRSNINKIYKNLIIKPPYMRCGLYNKKTISSFNFPAFLQLKADGVFQAVTVINGDAIFTSRSGEERKFPELKKEFDKLQDGVYIGEILVRDTQNRAEANGLINSDEPPHDRIYMQLWDYVTLDEYSRPKDKKSKLKYLYRFDKLKQVTPDTKNIEVIETHRVKNIQEAMVIVSKWMSTGLEGGVIKDFSNIFIDHTSPTQLKIKLVIDAEVRCTGFYEGKRGTKRVKTFGGMTYTTDDGKVQGRTSGFTDKQLKDFNSRREELTGKIFTIQFNDITKARSSDTFALSHPRFIEFRNDRTETDSLERIQEMKQMAMEVTDRKTSA